MLRSRPRPLRLRSRGKRSGWMSMCFPACGRRCAAPKHARAKAAQCKAAFHRTCCQGKMFKPRPREISLDDQLCFSCQNVPLPLYLQGRSWLGKR